MNSETDHTVQVYPYIQPVTPPHVVDAESETLSGNQNFRGGLEILNGGRVTVEESGDVEVHDYLKFSDGAVLINNGTLVAESITVTGTGNVISGEVISVRYIPTYHISDNEYHIMNDLKNGYLPWYPVFSSHNVYVKNGADLTISKDQYDAFQSICVEGSLFVEKSAGNALRQKDIDQIISSGSIRRIAFQQDLFDVKNLKFTEGIDLTVCFDDAYGTEKNDSVRFCKNAKVTLGTEGKVIDLFEGKNSIRTEANAQISILSDMFHINTIQVISGAKVRENRISHQLLTKFNCAGVTFSDGYAGNFTIGNFAIVSTGTLTGGSGTDKITAGSNSSLETGNIIDFEKITVSSGIKWKEYSSDSVKLQGHTCLTAGNIESDVSLKLTIGDYADCSIENITVGAVSYYFSPEDVWTYNIDESNDSIQIGKYSTLNASSVDLGNGKNSLIAGLDSQVSISGDVKGIYKLQIANGSRELRSHFTAGNIVGTDFSDTLFFGNYSVTEVQSVNLTDGWAEHPGNDRIIVAKYAQFQASSLTFGKGNDLLEIRDNATINISGLLNFDTGRDSLIIGKNAQVTLKASSADSLVKFTIGKETQAYLSSELLSCQELRGSKALLFDIGSAKDGVAQNFTTLSQEQEDDSFDKAAELTDTQYKGWLCGENALDTVDYFKRGTATQLICEELSEALTVSQWDCEGNLISSVQFGETIALNEKAAGFSVALESKSHLSDKAAAYHFTLV